MKGLAAIALCVLVLPGCGAGSDDGDSGAEDGDKRAATFACLRSADVDARLAGENLIEVGDARSGPRIRFYLTGGEAEAAQFQGEQEGSEQIGRALLFVRDGSEDLLEQIESCLVNP
ncbi:MAG TPA: hypothetical protein VEQ61_07015 [Thermoleophilaceae bacterium]|nr:hypothetical protein [Thermoleophilaceae bacterium]